MVSPGGCGTGHAAEKTTDPHVGSDMGDSVPWGPKAVYWTLVLYQPMPTGIATGNLNAECGMAGQSQEPRASNGDLLGIFAVATQGVPEYRYGFKISPVWLRRGQGRGWGPVARYRVR